MVDVFPRRAPVALGRYCDLRAAYFFKATCQRARERASVYHIGFIGFCNKVPCKLFLVGGGPPHAQPKISKTTPCKVAKRLLALDGFGDPAKAFDTSGKSAASVHHRAVHMTRARNGDRRQTETGKLAAELRGLTFFDDLPEVRCQLAIVTGKHLIQVPLGPDRRLQSPLFTPGGFAFVLLCFRF
jgi:hypothetical protein